MQDWQQRPEMLNGSPRGGPPSQQAAASPSPSPRGHLSSPGTDLESQDPSQNSPAAHAPLDQPAGIDSDDNFEVSDDADEQQVHLCWMVSSCLCNLLQHPRVSCLRQHLQMSLMSLTVQATSLVLSVQQQVITQRLTWESNK